MHVSMLWDAQIIFGNTVSLFYCWAIKCWFSSSMSWNLSPKWAVEFVWHANDLHNLHHQYGIFWLESQTSLSGAAPMRGGCFLRLYIHVLQVYCSFINWSIKDYAITLSFILLYKMLLFILKYQSINHVYILIDQLIT